MSEPVFKLSRFPNAPVSEEELIADLQRVAKLLGKEKLTQAQYELHGTYDRSTQEKRFGSWNMALIRADLTISNRINIPDVELFENILKLWLHYGRQPRKSEFASDPSSFSYRPYYRSFGDLDKTLRAFVDYANGSGAEIADQQIETAVGNKHKTGRDPSITLRWRVLQRDNFKCCDRGRSPAITPGIELHVDHHKPWSKGGETVFENLRTLCSKCNLGKSNLLPEVTDLLSN
jgi:hypothetical protein